MYLLKAKQLNWDKTNWGKIKQLRQNKNVKKIPSGRINGTKNVIFSFGSSSLSQFYF